MGLDHRFGHPMRLWETPYYAKTQLSRLLAETMIKAKPWKQPVIRRSTLLFYQVVCLTYFAERYPS
jgi:hypothetical protein